MRAYLAAFVIAAIACTILTPIVRRIALRIQALSAVGGRHVSARKIPRLGGVAIGLGLFLPVVALFFVNSSVAADFRRDGARVVALCGGGFALCAVGAIDDTRGIRALYKLYAHAAVAVCAWLAGFRIDSVQLPFVHDLSMGIFSLPVTVMWIVGVTNAVNLIDGLDGLAAGVVFFAGVTNFIVAYTVGHNFSALVMAALLGAVLAFLFYNFNPARIFMGDSGSYLLGFVLAATALVGPTGKATTAVSLLVPVVALGVPIFDTLFAMVRRMLERRPLFSPDRGHIHHRLIDLGLTHRRAVLILYAVSILLTVASIGIYLGRAWQVGMALLVTTVVMVGLVRFVGVFSYSMFARRQRARLRTRDTELLRRMMPALPARFARARSEEALLEELVAVAQDAELESVELRRLGTSGPPPDGAGRSTNAEPVVRWSNRRSDARRVVATMVYPIGNDALARAELELGAVNDFEDDQMPPQTDILLQVIADIMSENLVRVGSDLGPRVSRAPESRAETRHHVAADALPSRATAKS